MTTFLRRERLYLLLLIFVLLFNAAFSVSYRPVENGAAEISELLPDGKLIKAAEDDPFLATIFFLLFLGFIFFLIAGLVVNIVYGYLKSRHRDPIVKAQSIEECRWSLWDIGKVLIVFSAAQRAALLIDLFFFSGIPYLEGRDNLRLMISSFLADAAAILVVFHLVVNKSKQGIASLGLTARRFFSNIQYGIFSYAGLVPVLTAVMFLTALFFKVFQVPVEPQHIVILFRDEGHIPTIVCMAFFSVVLGPIVEEIFFRGFAYSAFKKRFGVLAGVAFSAVFFAAVHANLASFLPILCLGALLAYLFERTGSLVSSITVHIIHNSVTLSFLLFIKAIGG